MKKWRISLIATVVAVAMCVISDRFLGTAYTGNTYFQPFPHLLIMALIFCDFLFHYLYRQERARVSVPPKGKTLLDRVLIFLMVTMAFTMVGFMVEYFGK